jgi:hypothetical protein
MPKLERVVTVFTEVELASALKDGYLKVFGKHASDNVIVNAWCQCALECGRDGKGNISKCRNYNLGNITITKAQAERGVDYWALRCKEQLRDSKGKLTGTWKWFDMRFAANATLAAGAVHYWTFFKSQPYRKKVLDAMETGGPREVSKALADIWYYTANQSHYEKGMRRLVSVAEKSVKASNVRDSRETYSDSSPPPLTVDDPEEDVAIVPIKTVEPGCCDRLFEEFIMFCVRLIRMLAVRKA